MGNTAAAAADLHRAWFNAHVAPHPPPSLGSSLVTWKAGDPVPFSLLASTFEAIADTTKVGGGGTLGEAGGHACGRGEKTRPGDSGQERGVVHAGARAGRGRRTLPCRGFCAP